MTIKKNVSVPESADSPMVDRFKLDQDSGAKGASAATTIAVVAGLLALAVVGVLTFVIYQHWEYLQAA